MGLIQIEVDPALHRLRRGPYRFLRPARVDVLKYLRHEGGRPRGLERFAGCRDLPEGPSVEHDSARASIDPYGQFFGDTALDRTYPDLPDAVAAIEHGRPEKAGRDAGYSWQTQQRNPAKLGDVEQQ